MITRQEMLNRAVRGLRSQGWQLALETWALTASCMYLTPDGRRCAWGWVDPERTSDIVEGSVITLRQRKIGLAANLSTEDLKFACELQIAHDRSPRDIGLNSADELQKRFRALAELWHLEFPEDDGDDEAEAEADTRATKERW